ncbi:MAG: hypothetical protein VX438_17800 [Planctomycetota bacterium]|nr:hypothetical protein [Planctomycetota bacterium]
MEYSSKQRGQALHSLIVDHAIQDIYFHPGYPRTPFSASRSTPLTDQPTV